MNVRQPRRAAVVSALLLSLLSCTSSWAADNAAEGLQRCRALTESAARLSCYDSLAEQSAKAPAGAAVAIATATAAPAAAQTFGLTMQRQSEPDVIKTQIEGLVEGWGPGRTFTLANGQVWQVSDGSSAVLYLKNPKVEIRRAALGTFMLELEGTNETARVKRLR